MTKLSLGLGLESVHWSMEEMHPQLVSGRKLQIMMMDVIVVLGGLLSLEKSLADLCKEIITLVQEGIHHVHPSGARRVW